MEEYLGWCVLRILLVFIPQWGYIHPDEFFQGPEVVAKSVLSYNVSLPWEFQQKMEIVPGKTVDVEPIRNMFFPLLLQGLPFLLLSSVYSSPQAIPPYLLLVLPRLLLCLLSFVVDISLFVILRRIGGSGGSGGGKLGRRFPSLPMATLASSYVLLVYGTRTFSNTVELLLFSLLLAVTSQCAIGPVSPPPPEKSPVPLRSVHGKQGVTTPFYVGASQWASHIAVASLRPLTEKPVLSVPVLLTLGVFNRPTFLAFALVPVTWFLLLHRPPNPPANQMTAQKKKKFGFNQKRHLQGAGSQSGSSANLFGSPGNRIIVFKRVLRNLISILPISALCALSLIFLDSVWYNRRRNSAGGGIFSISLNPVDFAGNSFVEVLSKSISQFTIMTPLNFLKYNMNPENLAVHGTHPRFFHLVASFPFNFGAAGYLALFVLGRLGYNHIRCSSHSPGGGGTGQSKRHADGGKASGGGSSSKIASSSTIMSTQWMLGMAMVIPLLILSLFPHQEARFIIPLLIPVVILSTHFLPMFPPLSHKLFKLHWILFNLLCTLFFGFVHQAGVVRSTSFLPHLISQGQAEEVQYVIFSNTYSPPTFLMKLPDVSASESDSAPRPLVYFQTFGSLSVEQLEQKLSSILLMQDSSPKLVFLPLPGALDVRGGGKSKVCWRYAEEHESSRKCSSDQKILCHQKSSFFPHFSMEHLPSCSIPTLEGASREILSLLWECLDSLSRQLRLNIFLCNRLTQ